MCYEDTPLSLPWPSSQYKWVELPKSKLVHFSIIVFCSIEQEEDCGANNGENSYHQQVQQVEVCVCMHVCGWLKDFVVDSKVEKGTACL